MQLEFRIDWGYKYLYSRRHYHPIYVWDGNLSCTNGRIEKCFQLEYPVIWFGPGHCPRETELPSPAWQSQTRRELSGIRVVADVKKNAEFVLHTASGDFRFSAAEIIENGRIEFPVGPKYLGCHVIVTRDKYYWFRPAPKTGQQVWEADDLKGVPIRDWARMRMGWLAAGDQVSIDFSTSKSRNDVTETLLHLVAMAAPKDYTPGNEKQVHGEFPLSISVDGKIVAEPRQFLRFHDEFMQLLEDIWVRFPQAPAGKHKLTIKNNHPEFSLLISRVVISAHGHNHGELSVPRWGLTDKPLMGSVYATKAATMTVHAPDGDHKIKAVPGWNDFAFTVPYDGVNVVLTCGKNRGVIDAVYALDDEKIPVTVGYDMTVVPHDDNGFMDWLLNYTWRTQLGNLVVFRSFLYGKDMHDYRPVETKLLKRWGEYCRDHGIYVEAATDFDDGVLAKAAGKFIHSVGRHEWPGAVYAFDPAPGWKSEDMREAMEHYLAHLKIEIDRAHRGAKRAAFGDASGGHRYCYMAGADFLRTETMVPHTQHLCSQARPAAEALSDGEWGVHIAIHHPFQPYFETHLGQYFLSIFQPWVMGASMIYEEDSLFLLFKEERQAWDDSMTKGKRDMTRDFFRFVKTHPRQGKCRRRIAFLEGRYAAPFNGFICDTEQTPDYSVWGKFGNCNPEWGHRQPEKCRHLLDVLMPGANTQPLRQKFDKRRFFFSGTPYGDFDEVPVEATTKYLQQYSLLLNLGWNTMIDEDYAKLLKYVKAGGTLLTGLPQFSTHLRRDFLRDMDDLALYRNGDLAELCGVKVIGCGPRYSGQWNAANYDSFPQPVLSSLPNHDAGEDGVCRLANLELCGAEVVAIDADNGKPLVVCHKVGKGKVYLFTAWAYPGHQDFQSTAASWIAHLAEENRGDVYVEDPSGEVFWNVWEDDNGCRTLYMLNTDWTERGNLRQVEVVTPDNSVTVTVEERRPSIITILPNGAILEPQSPMDVHMELRADGLHVFGTGKQLINRYDTDQIFGLDFADSTECVLLLEESDQRKS